MTEKEILQEQETNNQKALREHVESGESQSRLPYFVTHIEPVGIPTTSRRNLYTTGAGAILYHAEWYVQIMRLPLHKQRGKALV